MEGHFLLHYSNEVASIMVFLKADEQELCMCKEERRWGSLKRGITLHLSMILEKVDLLNFFSWSLSGEA